MKHTLGDKGTIEAIENELKILKFLEEIRNISGAQIEMLTAEDVMTLNQEVYMISRQFFNLDKWRSHRRITQDMEVGETINSSDKTISGLVESKPVPLAPRDTIKFHGPSKGLVEYFDILYSQAVEIKEVTRRDQFFLDHLGSNSWFKRSKRSQRTKSPAQSSKRTKKSSKEVVNTSKKDTPIPIIPENGDWWLTKPKVIHEEERIRRYSPKAAAQRARQRKKIIEKEQKLIRNVLS